MAEARRCDRCNEFYSINDNINERGEYPVTRDYKKLVYSMTLYDNNVSRIKHLDLCPKCSRSLIVWLNDYGQYEEAEVKEIDVRDNHICKTCKFHSIAIYERPCSVCNNYDMYNAQVAIAKAEDVLKNAKTKACENCKHVNVRAGCEPCKSCYIFEQFEPKEDTE